MLEYKISDWFDVSEQVNVGKGSFKGEEALHTHEFIEISYIISGNAIHKVGENSYNLKRGDMIFINFHQTHSIISTEEMEYINILVQPSFISRELINSENAWDMLAISAFEEFSNKIEKIVPVINFGDVNIMQIENIMYNMLYEFNDKKVGYQSAIKGLLQVLLVNAFRQMRITDADVGVLEQVRKITPDILKYIEENCFEKFSVKELARRNFYNPAYFSRIFRDCFGMSISTYIKRRRIEKAVKLINESELTIEDIAQSVGYTDKKQFYKAFKEITNVSPGQMRQEAKKNK